MQKIVLNPETLGLLIDRIRRRTSCIFDLYHGQDSAPLHYVNWQTDNVCHIGKHCAQAEVRVHPFWKEQNTVFNFSRYAGKFGHPMIHIKLDAENALYFVWGDEFIFIGNNCVIIDQKVGLSVDNEKASNLLVKIVRVKQAKSISDRELCEIEASKTQCELAYDAWAKELERDFLKECVEDYCVY